MNGKDRERRNGGAKLIENYLNKFYCATLKGVFVD